MCPQDGRIPASTGDANRHPVSARGLLAGPTGGTTPGGTPSTAFHVNGAYLGDFFHGEPLEKRIQ